MQKHSLVSSTYTTLPGVFFCRQVPTPASQPRLLVWNEALATQLGLFLDASPQWLAAVFSGSDIPHGVTPIAQAYAGHQFGHLALLGDGRALLLGECVGLDHQRYDVQLKGAGQTPYSRRGDGRAALGPMLREYVMGEGMYGLGIPTTRALAVVATGDPVYRETVLPGAVLGRVAASHIRVGTFEYAALHQDTVLLRALADYTVQRHYPECAGAENPYLCFLEKTLSRQAHLVAKWMLVGFVHGVMNTDNVAISGETIDYGPCAFIDQYHPDTVFSSIDRDGRYAYGNQPQIMQWNLARFAETLLPLLHEDTEAALLMANEALQHFLTQFSAVWTSGMLQKLGILREVPGDSALVSRLLSLMQVHRLDYTNTFLALGEQAGFALPPVLDAWHAEWRERVSDTDWDHVRSVMARHNPLVIPRNRHVQHALDQAVMLEDVGPLHRLVGALRYPYSPSPDLGLYQDPGSGDTYRTFCGT